MSSYISGLNETLTDTGLLIATDIQTDSIEAITGEITTLMSTTANIMTATIGTLYSDTITGTTGYFTDLDVSNNFNGNYCTAQTMEITTLQSDVQMGTLQLSGYNRFDPSQGTSTGNRIRHYVNVFDDAKGNNYRITTLADADIDTPSSSDVLLGLGSQKINILPGYKPFITGIKGDASGYGELRLNPDFNGTPGKVSIGTPFSHNATNALEVVGSIQADSGTFTTTLAAAGMSATSATFTSLSCTTGTISTLSTGTSNGNTGTFNYLTASVNFNTPLATITTLGNTTFNSTYATLTNSTIGSLSCTSETVGTITGTNSSFTSASASTLVSTSANITSATIPTLSTTTLTTTTENVTNLNATNATISSGRLNLFNTGYSVRAESSKINCYVNAGTTPMLSLNNNVQIETAFPIRTTSNIGILTTGSFNSVITAASQAAERTITVPTVGANADIVLSESAQTINGFKTITGNTTFSGSNSYSNTNTYTNNVVMSASGMTAVLPVLDVTVAGTNTSHGIRIAANNATPTAPCVQLNNTTGNTSQAFINIRNGASGNNVISIKTADISALGAAISYTLPNVSTSADFIMSAGAQSLGGVKTFSSNPIMSSLTASQCVVTDGSKALASLAYTSANTASTIVQRDASSNFQANTLTLNGLTASRAVVTDASKVLSSLQYTSGNTASTIVSRDGSGDFATGKITLSTGIVLPNPSALSTFTLDHYEEFDYTDTWSGPWAAAQSGTLKCIRIGKLVTLYFPTVSAAGTVAAVITWGGTLKTWHMPLSTTYGPASISNNLGGFSSTGRVQINGAGAITIGSTNLGAAFSGSGTNGFINFSISYFTS